MRRNYDRKLSASKLNRGKCGNYRDTGVSKNGNANDITYFHNTLFFLLWAVEHKYFPVSNVFIHS